MVKIEKIGVSSAAKIYGLTLGILGFVIGIFYALFLSAFSGLLGNSFPISSAGGLGIVMVIAFPIMYGIMGFIIGALGSVIYNFVASKIGGLEIQLSKDDEIPL
ncbi:hypothetical protein [Algoriphagus aquimarinus]|uniref:DUF3566 domain-containing protein n=1 Tax=Algoriphagus aquimarinus TaxID=237018 RepID=A0A1I0WJ05_9BACT|nr:hypothetical protein [Algoriphagus aquimarinus]SFA88739.1 hypothetical protein SAMN04489723_102171 [Algoriphagus aquimarinus]|tara:strand:+ start:68982 stop:69293 length:312 start_codon:yes stop_codon:yes gene_type:complete